MSEITHVLAAVQRGDPDASDQLLPLVYDALRRLAAARMAHEAGGQTLQATALVHEAWLRLVGSGERKWNGRSHFFGAAAEAMRRILIEKARGKQRLKHGGGMERVDLDGTDVACGMVSEELLALNEALKELEQLDPSSAEVVKLRFFAGLTHPQIAEDLGISLSSVERAWAFSKVWLFQQVRGGGGRKKIL